VVRFEEVSLRYDAGPEILSRVTFALDPGSFHFIAGPSGAGKSSLLRLMFLAHQPTTGCFSLFGRDVAGLNRDDRALVRRRIGVVFQDFRLLDHLTVVENVALPLRVTGQKGQKIHEHVTELLTWVGLADQLNAYPATLSGGQQQRVAIARALVNDPEIVFADEPTGNLDSASSQEIMGLFTELNRRGRTVVLVTHDAEVAGYAERVLTVQDGRIVSDSHSSTGEVAP